MPIASLVAVTSRAGLARPLQIVLFCMLWSFAFVAGKVGVADCPPLLLLTARFLLAGVLILGLARLFGEHGPLRWRDIAVCALLGLANNALYLGFSYTGMLTVSAGLSGLIISANPVVTAVLAALLLNEPLTGRKIAGLALGVIGVTFIVWHRLALGIEGWQGVLFTLASLASLVAGTILFKRLSPQGSLWIGNGVQNLAAGVAMAPLAFSLSSVRDITPSWPLAAAFAFLVLGGSILAYWLWFRLLKLYGATAASAWHFVMPPLAMLFAWMVLGEAIDGRDLLGVIPVAIGIYLVTRPARQSAPGAS